MGSVLRGRSLPGPVIQLGVPTVDGLVVAEVRHGVVDAARVVVRVGGHPDELLGFLQELALGQRGERRGALATRARLAALVVLTGDDPLLAQGTEGDREAALDLSVAVIFLRAPGSRPSPLTYRFGDCGVQRSCGGGRGPQ